MKVSSSWGPHNAFCHYLYLKYSIMSSSYHQQYFCPYLSFCSKITFHQNILQSLVQKRPQRIRMQKLYNLLTNFVQCYLLMTQRKCCLFKTEFRTLFTESEWTNGPMSQAVVTSPMRLADCWSMERSDTNAIQLPQGISVNKCVCESVCMCVCLHNHTHGFS